MAAPCCEKKGNPKLFLLSGVLFLIAGVGSAFGPHKSVGFLWLTLGVLYVALWWRKRPVDQR